MSTSDDTQKAYTDSGSVPLGTIDPFDSDDKTQAIKRASSRLESDINDGAQIENPGSIHADAVENLATYRLLRPATGPGEQNYGMVEDYGERQLEYVQTYLEEYQRIVESINAADPDEIEGGDDTTPDEGGNYTPTHQFQSF